MLELHRLEVNGFRVDTATPLELAFSITRLTEPLARIEVESAFTLDGEVSGLVLEINRLAVQSGGWDMDRGGGALTWSYSLARLFVPWIAMLSLTVAFKRGEHIAMAMLLTRTPRAFRRFAQIVSLVLIGLFGVALAWFGAEFFIGSNQLFMISDFLQLSHKWVTAAVPVSGVILCVHLADGAALLGTDAAIDGPIDAEERA